MLEKEVLKQYKIFNKRRLSNRYNNVKAEKEYYFSSCGDEFFRNEYQLNKLVKGLNNNGNLNLGNVFNVNSYFNIVEFYEEKVNPKNNVILFRACRKNKIPFIYTNIDFLEIFSTHADFHAMIYNEQTVTYRNHYIWILFKWFKVKNRNYDKLGGEQVNKPDNLSSINNIKEYLQQA